MVFELALERRRKALERRRERHGLERPGRPERVLGGAGQLGCAGTGRRVELAPVGAGPGPNVVQDTVSEAAGEIGGKGSRRRAAGRDKVHGHVGQAIVRRGFTVAAGNAQPSGGANQRRTKPKVELAKGTLVLAAECGHQGGVAHGGSPRRDRAPAR